MQFFVHEALPTRVISGPGTITQLKAEAERLGVAASFFQLRAGGSELAKSPACWVSGPSVFMLGSSAHAHRGYG